MRAKTICFRDACEMMIAFNGCEKWAEHLRVEWESVVEMMMDVCFDNFCYETGGGALFMSRVPGDPISIVCVVTGGGCMRARNCYVFAKCRVDRALWWTGEDAIIVRGSG